MRQQIRNCSAIENPKDVDIVVFKQTCGDSFRRMLHDCQSSGPIFPNGYQWIIIRSCFIVVQFSQAPLERIGFLSDLVYLTLEEFALVQVSIFVPILATGWAGQFHQLLLNWAGTPEQLYTPGRTGQHLLRSYIA